MTDIKELVCLNCRVANPKCIGCMQLKQAYEQGVADERARWVALRDACKGLLSEVYIGGGQVICPPALAPHLRAIVRAMTP